MMDFGMTSSTHGNHVKPMRLGIALVVVIVTRGLPALNTGQGVSAGQATSGNCIVDGNGRLCKQRMFFCIPLFSRFARAFSNAGSLITSVPALAFVAGIVPCLRSLALFAESILLSRRLGFLAGKIIFLCNLALFAGAISPLRNFPTLASVIAMPSLFAFLAIFVFEVRPGASGLPLGRASPLRICPPVHSNATGRLGVLLAVSQFASLALVAISISVSRSPVEFRKRLGFVANIAGLCYRGFRHDRLSSRRLCLERRAA